MRVLVNCEYSAAVRDAFRERGHDAWSCDTLPTEGDPRWHIQGDALDAMLSRPWDLMIAHPPCTYLTVAGMHWNQNPKHVRGHMTDSGKTLGELHTEAALAFVEALMAAPIKRIAIENPISVISSRIRKPDQIIQPWQFGHGETKATCLWLKNLPKLKPTSIVEGREQKVWKMPPGPDRWKERSRTFKGIAEAMAAQWGLTTFPGSV